jgi:hypothetical protein
MAEARLRSREDPVAYLVLGGPAHAAHGAKLFWSLHFAHWNNLLPRGLSIKA